MLPAGRGEAMSKNPPLRRKLGKALMRWWPDQGVADLREADDEALDYILKQMTPQAAYVLRFLVTRERASRHDLAKVAVVLGSRVGMTSNLRSIIARPVKTHQPVSETEVRFARVRICGRVATQPRPSRPTTQEEGKTL